MIDESYVNKVYRIPWTEYERGWGQRPDGATLHLTLTHAKRFITNHRDQMSEQVPNTYIKPDLDPYKDTLPMVDVHSDVYMMLVEKDGSMWEPIRIEK